MNITKTLIIMVTVSAVMLGLLWCTNTGLAKAERNECMKWQEQAEEDIEINGDYPHYFLNEWQAEQCEAQKIEVNAVVRVFYEDGSFKDFDNLEELRAWYK